MSRPWRASGSRSLDILQTLPRVFAVYKNRRLYLVIVEYYEALQFAEQYRDRMFPGVPIVFMVARSDRLKGQELWPNTTGVTSTVDIQGTINLAMRFHPDTTAIAVVTNTSEFERYWLGAVHAVLLGYREKLREIDLVGLPAPQLLQAIATLPPHTLVLVQLAPQASIQPLIGNDEIVEKIARQRPTYCIAAQFCLDHGGVGTADVEDGVPLAVDMAARVLSGQRPENIPIAEGVKHPIRIDWRQLRR